MVRLSEAVELGKALQVLRHGGASREEWLRVHDTGEGEVKRRLAINKMAITQFHDLAGQASRQC